MITAEKAREKTITSRVDKIKADLMIAFNDGLFGIHVSIWSKEEKAYLDSLSELGYKIYVPKDDFKDGQHNAFTIAWV